jgi:hypothetical protein
MFERDFVQARRLPSAGQLAKGLQRLIGPGIAIGLALYFFVLSEPILVTRFMIFSRHEIALSKLAIDLYRTDTFLFLVVFVFGILAPGFKLIMTALSWYILPIPYAQKLNPWMVVISKLSMLDVMLLAIIVVSIKGVGVGSVEIKPGLYAYITLILGSFFLSLWIERVLPKFDADAPP